MGDFTDGLEKIQCFTRWSKHGDLKMYADRLEEWDDIVGEKWEEPATLTLDPITWISDTDTYKNR
jgi:dynein heavy chain